MIGRKILTNSDVNFDFKFNKMWRKIILNNLKIKSSKYYYGYYVWSDAIKSEKIVKYISRYVRHPAIADGRIAKISKNKIEFFYLDAKGNEITIKKPIDSFISSLIQHIPPRQFKTIRHYGIYSRKNK